MRPQIVTQAKLEQQRTQKINKLTEQMRELNDKRNNDEEEYRATRHKLMMDDMLMSNKNQINMREKEKRFNSN